MTHFKLLTKTVLFACVVLATNASLNADIIAYRVGSPSVGSQAFTGSLGMDFDVLAPIVITEMGVFDSNQDGFAGTTLTAQIWDRNTQTLIAGTTETFTSADPGTLIEGSRFKTPGVKVELNPGNYVINAFGYNATELNGNNGSPADKSTNDGGGLISFVGGGRFHSTPGCISYKR